METLPLLIPLVLVGLYLLIGIRVIQEYQRAVLFRLGRLAGLRGPGLTWVAPIFETAQILDLRVVTQSVAQQETITKDSVTTKVDAVLWYHIKAEAELEAAVKLTESAGLMSAHPAALELRRMQMISEVGAEHNTTTIIMMPSEFVSMAKTLSEKLGK